MDQLAGDLLNDSDSDDQDYVPSGGESDHEEDEANKSGDELADENEAEKRKTDALWADFMADVEPLHKKAKLNEAKEESTKLNETNSQQAKHDEKETKPPSVDAANEKQNSSSEGTTDDKPGSSKIKLTQVFDFAGEKIEVEKEVEKDSKEAKKLLAEQAKQQESEQKVLVRPKVGGGLSTIVGSVLNKKNKMSILEKSRLDWNGFKQTEGITEELSNHNKGKGGYLEKMAFLDRTDLRQFEIEKSMREKQRSSRGGNT